MQSATFSAHYCSSCCLVLSSEEPQVGTCSTSEAAAKVKCLEARVPAPASSSPAVRILSSALVCPASCLIKCSLLAAHIATCDSVSQAQLNLLCCMQIGAVCETDEDCYAAVERHRFVWAAAEDVRELAVSHPGEFTAAVVFTMPHSDTAPIDSFTLQVCYSSSYGGLQLRALYLMSEYCHPRQIIIIRPECPPLRLY